jgi:hypothetical protein
MSENNTQPTLQEQIEQLQAENAALKAKTARKLTLKVSEKGALSLYGINSQFPVTLYKEQWAKVLGMAEEIKAFIAANDAKLTVKTPKA